MNRKPLVEDSGFFKTTAVMLFCHASVAFLCVNVMFDLFVFGVPLFVLHTIGLLQSNLFYKLTSVVINWTTPIVYGIPMILSGTRVYIDNVDILIESKENDSLLLANHGSRIDWMVGMLIGHLDKLGNRPSNQCRVGFVCEALIQLMPLVGWYRKVICDDIFVWRSFDKDAPTIKENISKFHLSGEKRMLVLSPEGVVVDHSDRDMAYVQQCRDFCNSNGFKPFDYVLTPRYKGTTCLLDQISSGGGPFVSACLVFIRDGKLLNCKLLSPYRVIPDIYDLNQGVAGKPVSIYVHVRKMDAKRAATGEKNFDAKATLMQEYAWKDSVLAKWEEVLQKQQKQENPQDDLASQFTEVERNCKEVLINHIAHIAVMVASLAAVDLAHLLVKVYCWVFFSVAFTHTVGWLVNESSMESVPFETGIKALMKAVEYRMVNCRKKNV